MTGTDRTPPGPSTTRSRRSSTAGSRGRAPGGRWALLLAPALVLVAAPLLAALAFDVAVSLGYQPYLDSWSWTTRAYAVLADDPAVRASLQLTARTSLLATGGAAVLALAIGVLLHGRGRRRRALVGLLQVGLPVPHLVAALMMALLLAGSGLISRLTQAVGVTRTPAGFPALTQEGFGWAILAEYLWKETPFVALVVLTALAQAPAGVADVAATLGAGPWRRLLHVVLPQVAPALAAASVVVFAFTLGSYQVPAVLGRPYPAPLAVVGYQRLSDTDLAVRPQGFAIGVLIAAVLAATVGIGLLVARLAVRRGRR